MWYVTAASSVALFSIGLHEGRFSVVAFRLVLASLGFAVLLAQYSGRGRGARFASDPEKEVREWIPLGGL